MPSNYVDWSDSGNLDFLQRLLQPNAETLQFVWRIYNAIPTYVSPETANDTWIDWLLQEWFGWTLYPDSWKSLRADFVLSRKRRLLGHFFGDFDQSGFGLHYPNRGTIPGIKNLLLEFGVHALVTDQPLYAGGYLGADFPGSVFPVNRAANWPLEVRVVVQYYEPAEIDFNTFVGGYLGNPSGGNIYLYDATPYVTDSFVVKLVEWSRAAGVKAVIEWRTAEYQSPESIIVLG